VIKVVDKDEGVRADTTLAGLGKLRAAFKEGGSTTAGNSSQVSDGAAVALLTKRSVAQRLGLPIVGVFRSFAVVGVDPSVMGIGPAYAIPAAVKKAGLKLSDIDVFEINEAFASQATYCVAKLGIDPEKVNVNGGAIALGHPLVGLHWCSLDCQSVARNEATQSALWSCFDVHRQRHGRSGCLFARMNGSRLIKIAVYFR